MSGVNKVILIGNLGKDPEIRTLESGVKVASFSLATTEVYRQNGEKKETTEWHNLVLWRGLADVAEKYLRKGSQIYVDGKIRSRSWEDKDKIKRYTTEIVVDNLTMLGSRVTEPNVTNENTSTTPQNEQNEGNVNGDDLPF